MKKILAFLFSVFFVLIIPHAGAIPCQEHVVIQGVTSGTLENCQGVKSITVQNAQNIVIRQNTIADSTLGSVGIKIVDSRDVQILSNSVDVPNGLGIEVTDGQNIEVRGNTLQKKPLRVRNGQRVKILGNQFLANENPLEILDSFRTDVASNIINQKGLLVRGGNLTNISANNFTGTGLVSIENSGVTLLEDNSFYLLWSIANKGPSAGRNDKVIILSSGLFLTIIKEDVKIGPLGEIASDLPYNKNIPEYRVMDFPYLKFVNGTENVSFVQRIEQGKVTITPIYEGQEADSFSVKGDVKFTRNPGPIPKIFTDDTVVLGKRSISNSVGNFEIEGLVSGEMTDLPGGFKTKKLEFSTGGKLSKSNDWIEANDSEVRITRQIVLPGSQPKNLLAYIVGGRFEANIRALDQIQGGFRLFPGATLMDVGNLIQIEAIQEMGYPNSNIQVGKNSVQTNLPLIARVNDLIITSQGSSFDTNGFDLNAQGKVGFETNDVGFSPSVPSTIKRKITEGNNIVEIGGPGRIIVSGEGVEVLAPGVISLLSPFELSFTVSENGIAADEETKKLLEDVKTNSKAALYFRKNLFVKRGEQILFSITPEGMIGDVPLTAEDALVPQSDVFVFEDVTPQERNLFEQGDTLEKESIVQQGNEQVIDNALDAKAKARRLEALISYSSRKGLEFTKGLELRKAFLEGQVAGFQSPTACSGPLFSPLQAFEGKYGETGETNLLKARLARVFCDKAVEETSGVSCSNSLLGCFSACDQKCSGKEYCKARTQNCEGDKIFSCDCTVRQEEVASASFYQKAKRFPETSDQAGFDLAQVYLTVGDYGKAYQEYQRLTTSADETVRSHAYLGISDIALEAGDDVPPEARGLSAALANAQTAIVRDPSNTHALEKRKILQLGILDGILKHAQKQVGVLREERYRINTGKKLGQTGFQAFADNFCHPIETINLVCAEAYNLFSDGKVDESLDALSKVAVKEYKGIQWLYKLVEAGNDLSEIEPRNSLSIAKQYVANNRETVSDRRPEEISLLIATALENPDVINLQNNAQDPFNFEKGETGVLFKEKDIIPFFVTTRSSFFDIAMLFVPFTKVGVLAKIPGLARMGITSETLTINLIGKVTGLSKVSARLSRLPVAGRVASELAIPTAASLVAYSVNPVLGGVTDVVGLGFNIPGNIVSKIVKTSIVDELAKKGLTRNQAKAILSEAGIDTFASKIQLGTLKKAEYDEFLERVAGNNFVKEKGLDRGLNSIVKDALSLALAKISVQSGLKDALRIAENSPIPKRDFFGNFRDAASAKSRLSKKNLKQIAEEIQGMPYFKWLVDDQADLLSYVDSVDRRTLTRESLRDQKLAGMLSGSFEDWERLIEAAEKYIFLNDIDLAIKSEVLGDRLRYTRGETSGVLERRGKGVRGPIPVEITRFASRRDLAILDLIISLKDMDVPVIQSIARNLNLFVQTTSLPSDLGVRDLAGFYSGLTREIRVQSAFTRTDTPVHETIHYLSDRRLFDTGRVREIYQRNFDLFRERLIERARSSHSDRFRRIAEKAQRNSYSRVSEIFIDMDLGLEHEFISRDMAGEAVSFSALSSEIEKVKSDIRNILRDTPLGGELGWYGMYNPDELLARSGERFFGFGTTSLADIEAQGRLKRLSPEMFAVFEEAFDPTTLELKPQALQKVMKDPKPLVSAGSRAFFSIDPRRKPELLWFDVGQTLP